MTSEIITKQLKKVKNADLSNYDAKTNSYFIKKRVDIKLEEEGCYLIKVKPSLFNNEVLRTNWNQGIMPQGIYLQVEITKIMPKMIKTTGVCAKDLDSLKKSENLIFWSGWLSVQDIEVLQKIK